MCDKIKKDLSIIKVELKKIQSEISNFKNKEYELNKEYIELLKNKCKKNIGRCFKKMKDNEIISYCKIIDIDKEIYTTNNELRFNEYLYQTILFQYPYNNSKLPFNKNNLHSGTWGEGNDILNELKNYSYIEITNEEFNNKFNEVNLSWIKNIENI